jgi:hypothetical protein
MLILYRCIWLVYVYFGLSAPILPTITADNRESTVNELVSMGARSDEVNGLFFPIYLILPAALGPGVYSTSNRNEYQKKKCFCG